MLSKLTLALLLTASLSCFGQVVSTGGYATTAGPAATPVSAANAPLVSTPDIALPGSGPAHGSPLGNTNTNDSRFSTGPSVYNPNSIPAESASANAAAATQSAPTGNAAAANEPFEFGVQQVITEAPNASAPPLSLGEIARNLRAHPVQPTKMINNDTVARLNANPRDIGNIIPQRENTTVAAAGTAPITPPPAPDANLIARNQAPALPQSDQSEAAEQPQAPSANPSATAGQQRRASNNAGSSQAVAAPPAADSATAAQATNSNQAADTRSRLPQTASHLPLLLLFGGLGVAGGALYLIRR
jgi:LPXTG-motif cell wall-anchored protein